MRTCTACSSSVPFPVLLYRGLGLDRLSDRSLRNRFGHKIILLTKISMDEEAFHRRARARCRATFGHAPCRSVEVALALGRIFSWGNKDGCEAREARKQGGHGADDKQVQMHTSFHVKKMV